MEFMISFAHVITKQKNQDNSITRYYIKDHALPRKQFMIKISKFLVGTIFVSYNQRIISNKDKT